MESSFFTQEQEKLARYAKALSHPVRVYIMELLSSQSCCFSGDLAEDLPIARSTLSQHLKELKESGLIQGNIEYPKIRYCINRENWEEARKLLGELFGGVTQSDA
ncbi:MAG: metalloregulator ArsR/SmtB family transcription factor [Bacteroidota bacterium]|nr:metalloregulator ArsR/SmtB family transcription factor [Bacteroidota bacterium]